LRWASGQKADGFSKARDPGALTLSGQVGDDAKPYQEKQIRKALEEIHEDD
jgi:hypothetical protein